MPMKPLLQAFRLQQGLYRRGFSGQPFAFCIFSRSRFATGSQFENTAKAKKGPDPFLFFCYFYGYIRSCVVSAVAVYYVMAPIGIILALYDAMAISLDKIVQSDGIATPSAMPARVRL